jgi:hypothetical protein
MEFQHSSIDIMLHLWWHWMVHRCNFILQIFSNLLIISRLKFFIQYLYYYFFKSLKKHLDFVQLAQIMETKGSKILKNVKTH